MEVPREQVYILNGPKYNYPKVFHLEDIHEFSLDVFEKMHLYAVSLPPNWWRYLFHKLFEYMYYKYEVESPLPIRALDHYLHERDPDVLREIRNDLRHEVYGACTKKSQILSWMVYEFVNGVGPGVMSFLLNNFNSKEEEPWIMESVVEFLTCLREDGVQWLQPNWGPTPYT